MTLQKMMNRLITSELCSGRNVQPANADEPSRRTSAGLNWWVELGRSTFQLPPLEVHWTERGQTVRTVEASLPSNLAIEVDNAKQGRTNAWPVGQRTRKAEVNGTTAEAMLGNTGRRLGQAGRTTTAAGGQTSSAIRRFLTGISLTLPYLLNVGNFVPLCWKKCTSSGQKCTGRRGKHVPLDVPKCTGLTLLWLTHGGLS